MSQDAPKDEEPVRYHHEFTEEEGNMMMYFGDPAVEPVQEYHYMKKAWQTPDAIIGAVKKPIKTSVEPNTDSMAPTEKHDLQQHAIDNGHRTVVDLNKDTPKDEEPVFLSLDTSVAAHIVEFYAPWCPHCRYFKQHYVDVAREVTRRSIATPVYFHAVSCELYREVCRAYDADGYPIVLGYAVGESIQDRGWELNVEGIRMTAQTVADTLHLELALEAKDLVERKNFTNSADRRVHKIQAQVLAKAAAAKKTSWHQYPSSLNDRYHNAAVSLAFALKTGVFVKRESTLDDRRVLALRDFLELVDWATPQSWHVRTGMVKQVLGELSSIVSNQARLIEIVENHQSLLVEGGLWGDLEVSQRTRGHVLGLGGDAPMGKAPVDVDEVYWKNIRWTEACTHSERGMGFTCGLWDLFHIISIGSSMPVHQIYGFHSGYLISPRHVAESIKRFVANFFACDVCRWNFVDMYDNCGHNHCERLGHLMPAVISSNATVGNDFAMWLWEAHNAINIRLMKESAVREDRLVTDEEARAAIFPTMEMCPDCWHDTALKRYDEDAIFDFLTHWYWPAQELPQSSFKAVVRRRKHEATATDFAPYGMWIVIIPAAITMIRCMRRKLSTALQSNTHGQRKNV